AEHELIQAEAAVNTVVAGTVDNGVLPSAADDRIIRRAEMLEAVGELEELDVLERIGAVRRARAQIGDGRGVTVDGDLVVRELAAENGGIASDAAVERVVAGAACHGVIAVTTVEMVIADATDQLVISLTARERVAAGAGLHKIVVAGAEEGIGMRGDIAVRVL